MSRQSWWMMAQALSKALKRAALDRIVSPAEFVFEAPDDTVGLSTPVVSVQDGPRMAFNGKKAPPFTSKTSKLPTQAKKSLVKKMLKAKKG